VHAIIIFDEMQNGAIWGHFRVSYNIESSTILMILIDKNILKLSKMCSSCLGSLVLNTHALLYMLLDVYSEAKKLTINHSCYFEILMQPQTQIYPY
jgi:hypothetical protein